MSTEDAGVPADRINQIFKLDLLLYRFLGGFLTIWNISEDFKGPKV